MKPALLEKTQILKPGFWLGPLAALLLVAATACGHDRQSISGQVVDEQGQGVAAVAVVACYSGWGWSQGSLVWDKDSCSEPVLTDGQGRYLLQFSGPDLMRLQASKAGWIQTRDFNSTVTRITLSRAKEQAAREKAAARVQTAALRQRQPHESDQEYYCRVILPANRAVTIHYRDEVLALTPVLLSSGDQGPMLFALRGSADKVRTFAAELSWRINGQRAAASCEGEILPACQPDIYLIRCAIQQGPAASEQRLELLIPSIRAMLDMRIFPGE